MGLVSPLRRPLTAFALAVLAGLALVAGLFSFAPDGGPGGQRTAWAGPALQVATGSSHTCALTLDGTVKCWGHNGSGQLGIGSSDGYSHPYPLDVCAPGATPPCEPGFENILTGVSAITAGGSHTCALMSGGGVKCWGQNTSGQLGDGTSSQRNTPADVCASGSGPGCSGGSALTGVSSVSAGSNHTCAVVSGGVKCWGENASGQLGDGNSPTDSDTPVDVWGLGSGMAGIGAGGNLGTEGHSCAVTATGGAKCWGENGDGQLGNNNGGIDSDVPVDVCEGETCPPYLSGIENGDLGGAHTCSITATSIKCCGFNYSGQLGDGTTDDSDTPVGVWGFAPTPTPTITNTPTPTPTYTPTATPTPTGTPPPTTLTIGALVPLTGDLGWVGPGLANAAQLAADHVNAESGVLGGTLQVVVGDTASDPATGVAAAENLIDVQGADVIVGAAASGVTIPVAETVTVPRSVLQISPASTSPALGGVEDDDFLFQTALSDAHQGVVLAELAREERGYETASTLYLNDPYGQGLSAVFTEEFERRGGQVLAQVPHERYQGSYLEELANATAGDPDVLVAISYPDDATDYLIEALGNDLIDEFLFVDGTRSQDMINDVCAVIGSGCLDGMYGTAPASADTPAGLAFDEAYELEYLEPPTVFARHAYDAVILTALAAEAAGSSDSSLIRDELRDVSRPGGELVGLGESGGIGHALDEARLGHDVDYDGASGCVDLGVHGDPTCGWTEVWHIAGDSIVSDSIDPIVPEPAIISVDMDPATAGVQTEGTIDLDEASDFSIDIYVNGVVDPGLDSFTFELVYDDSRVDGTAVLEGPFLGSNGASTWCSEQNPDVDGATGPNHGRARLTCEVASGTPALGEGVLGTVLFDASGTPGGAPLSFDLDNVTLTHPTSASIPQMLQNGSAQVVGVAHVLAGTGVVTGSIDGEGGNPADDLGDGGQAQFATTNHLSGVYETGTATSTYFADTGNHRIRRISPSEPTGIVTTVAGNGVATGSIDGPGGNPADDLGDGGPAASATVNGPVDVFLDEAGNIYIADTGNHRIRKVDTAGTITTVAGTGVAGYSGDGDPATSAELNGPRGVAVDADGNIYIADTENHVIRRVDAATGDITTVAGTGAPGFIGDGGPAIAARLNRPHDVYMYGQSGDFLIADTINHRIRRVVDGPSPIIVTFAGTGVAGYSGDDGLANLAQLNGPEAIAADTDDMRLPSVLIADTQNHAIRKVNGRSSVITTVAGTGMAGAGPYGGPATSTKVNGPAGVAVGTITIGDTGNSKLVSTDPSTGEPGGRFSGFSCTFGSVATGDWLLALLPLGLVLFRRRIRGLIVQIRLMAGLAPRPKAAG